MITDYEDDEIGRLEQHLHAMPPWKALLSVAAVMVVALAFGAARLVTAPWRHLRHRSESQR